MLRGRFLFCFGQLLIEFHPFGHTGTFTGPGFGALYKAVSIHHRTVILPLLFLSGDADHELLVETNKLEVFGDIAAWLDKQLAKQ